MWHSPTQLEVMRSYEGMRVMWHYGNEDGRVGSFRWLLGSYCWKFFPTNICL